MPDRTNQASSQIASTASADELDPRDVLCLANLTQAIQDVSAFNEHTLKGLDTMMDAMHTTRRSAFAEDLVNIAKKHGWKPPASPWPSLSATLVVVVVLLLIALFEKK